MSDDSKENASTPAKPRSVPPAPKIKDGPAHLAENATAPIDASDIPDTERAAELGGQKGPEPTRYGDWERAGRCTDF